MFFLVVNKMSKFSYDKTYIAQLANKLQPGQKLLTCAYCGYVGVFPEWQQEVNCITRFLGNPCRVHPGEVSKSPQFSYDKSYVAALASTLTPGTKLLTCAHCGYIGKYPESQLIVSCITKIVGQPCRVHPGEIKR